MSTRQGKRVFVLAIAMMLGTQGLAEDMTPSQVFAKVKAAYKSMDSYKAQGTIRSDIETGDTKMKIETSFSMILKKPNRYLISWTQKNMTGSGMSQSGAVWSDGTQAYLYMGIMKAYSKMNSDELALASATGISGGAAFTIPSLFLSAFKEQPAPFSRLEDPKLEMMEKVGKEACFVISGASAISKKEAFWISKKSYLIKKYYRSLEAPEGGRQMPDMTDEQLDEAIKGMGQAVTEESRQKMREIMKQSEDLVKKLMKGSSAEVHVKISSPKLKKEDFQFTLPAGTVLKESLFGGVLNAGK
jgi:hypothetical protein